jgi:hypothetical protein
MVLVWGAASSPARLACCGYENPAGIACGPRSNPYPTVSYRRRRRPSDGHRAALVGVLAVKE